MKISCTESQKVVFEIFFRKNACMDFGKDHCGNIEDCGDCLLGGIEWEIIEMKKICPYNYSCDLCEYVEYDEQLKKFICTFGKGAE